MSHLSFHDSRFLLMTQEMNPCIALIQYVKLFQNVTNLEMKGKEIIKKTKFSNDHSCMYQQQIMFWGVSFLYHVTFF